MEWNGTCGVGNGIQIRLVETTHAPGGIKAPAFRDLAVQAIFRHAAWTDSIKSTSDCNGFDLHYNRNSSVHEDRFKYGAV